MTERQETLAKAIAAAQRAGWSSGDVVIAIAKAREDRVDAATEIARKTLISIELAQALVREVRYPSNA